MKRTHWLRNTLIVLGICALAGTVFSVVLFNHEGIRTYVSSSVQFSFNGADKGIAPNGNVFDVSGLTSDEVLDFALEASGLTGVYTAEQLRENMNVAGQYPSEIVEQMTQYISLLDTETDMQTAIQEYRATQYEVILYNDFDRSITSAKLSDLLNNIMNAYRKYFVKYYSASLDVTDPIENLSDYDYSQQLEAISEYVFQHKRYALELAEMAPDFMVGQKGFGDIAVRYENLESDIDRLNATITLNAVSKDRERLQKRYEMEIRSQQYQLDSLTEELKLIEAQVNSYDKDGIIYVSSSGSLNAVGSDETGTYDKLVEKRKNVTDKIAQIKAEIAKYQGRLEDMTGLNAKETTEIADAQIDTANVLSDDTINDGTSEEENAAAVEQLTQQELIALQETVEQKILALLTKRNTIATDFVSMLDAYAAEQINERTVLIAAVKYKAPSLFSGRFLWRFIKTVGPFCTVGFIVCVILMIISRRKEEKALRT